MNGDSLPNKPLLVTNLVNVVLKRSTLESGWSELNPSFSTSLCSLRSTIGSQSISQ
ncbi:hypothetical protein J6590_010246 [Homalodisca vitripennis]|nr:hypothetical protein J6590_010246 [Homalodisca vitripennis]